MYKCHLCDLETPHLNGLMSRHYKIHCDESYTREQYKIDVLAHNGRPQKLCRVCGNPTTIPKGESEYPDYHRECYTKSIIGTKNPNFKGKLREVSCAYCGKPKYTYSSSKNIFCSTSCSTRFYSIPDNQSEAKREAVERQRNILREKVKDEKFKEARIKAMLRNQQIGSSNIERLFYEHVKKVYPDAVNGYQIDFYSVDVWIPSIKTAIDVQGNYWHNKPEVRSVDRAKIKYFINNRSDIKFYRIWESEIRDGFYTYDKSYDATAICCPRGSGKWIGESLRDRYDVIDCCTDLVSYETMLKTSSVEAKPKLFTVNASNISHTVKKLRSLGYRINVVCLVEKEEEIRSRIELDGVSVDLDAIRADLRHLNTVKDKISMFYGNQQEVIRYLMNYHCV